jgi:carboxylesterase type B
MKPRHSQQLVLLPVVLFAAVALCSMPLVVHAQEQKPLVFTFSGPVRGSVTSAGVREFLGIPYAAARASELQYLFALPVTVPRPPLNAQQLQLSRSMQRYWTNFAKFGNPNGPGVPVWQEFNPGVGNFQSLIPPSPVQETDFAASHHCAFWAALLSAQ